MEEKEIIWLTDKHTPFLDYKSKYKIIRYEDDMPVIKDNHGVELILDNKEQYKIYE